MTHNLAYVRVNLNDGTLHCERHGLLGPIDEQATLAASALSIAQIYASNLPRPIAWVFDAWGKWRHRSEPCA